MQPTPNVLGYEDHGYVGTATLHETKYGSVPRRLPISAGVSAMGFLCASPGTLCISFSCSLF